MPLFQTNDDNSETSSGGGRSVLPSSGKPRAGLTFATEVAPNSTETLTHRVSRNATVESIKIRFYQGPRLAVSVTPFVDHAGDDGETPLLRTVGKEAVDGDNDVYEFGISVPVDEGDTLTMGLENTDPDFSYNVRTNLELDYAGGGGRFLGGFL